MGREDSWEKSQDEGIFLHMLEFMCSLVTDKWMHQGWGGKNALLLKNLSEVSGTFL